jgi:hypothetical protein
MKQLVRNVKIITPFLYINKIITTKELKGNVLLKELTQIIINYMFIVD